MDHLTSPSASCLISDPCGIQWRVDIAQIECDYYHFVQVGAELDFEQEQAYLANYEWAEFF